MTGRLAACLGALLVLSSCASILGLEEPGAAADTAGTSGSSAGDLGLAGQDVGESEGGSGAGGQGAQPLDLEPGLQALELSHGVLEPAFDAATLRYRVRVGLAVTELSVTPIARDSRATVLVNQSEVASGERSASFPLALSADVDATTTVTLMADAGTPDEKTYTIDVERASGLFEEHYLKASNARPNDRLGSSLALSRGTLVVGAPLQDGAGFGVDSDQASSDGEDCGAVYVFVETERGWTQQAYLKASNPRPFDGFGAAVGLSGDLLVVGAPGEDGSARSVDGEMNEPSTMASGAVYVFQRVAGHWAQRAYLKASDSSLGNGFGASAAISGNRVVVGAPGHVQPESLESAGAAYVFELVGQEWRQIQMLSASRPGFRDSFGASVAISGNRLVVGAPGESSGSADESLDSSPMAGAAYVFEWNKESWKKTALLKASNARASALFGAAVSIDADDVAVGSPGESSTATGVDGQQASVDAPGSGAVYVYRNTGQATSWEQTAYVKASNAEPGDWFGSSVSLQDGVLAAASTGASSFDARGEDSSASGIDGEQQNERAEQSGAVYLFARVGEEWAQQAYVKASNSEEEDYFGSALAVADGALAVGAMFEDSDDADDPNGAAASSSGAVYVRSLLALAPATGARARGLVSLDVLGFVTGFVPDQLDYEIDMGVVDHHAQTVELTAAPADPDAEVVVTDQVGTLLDDWSAIDVAPGDNRFSVHVVASSGAYTTYTLNLRRPIPVIEALDEGSPLDVSSGMLWEQASDSSVVVDVSGDTLVVGVPGEDLAKDRNSSDEATTQDSGVVYVFVRGADGWQEQDRLKASNADFNNQFGAALALDGDTLVVGAPAEASLSQSIDGDQTQNAIGGARTGAAYVFVRSEGKWQQQAYLKAFNAASYAYFGEAVAIDGDRIVIGARGESSLAFGVNDEITGVAPSSGAAYLYQRSGEHWSLEAHLKASNTEPDQRFGTRVAIFGKTIAVTATEESGGSSAINGNQHLSPGVYGGAVYTFIKQGSAEWQNEAYIKAPNYHFDVDFGRSLALGENVLVVGATGDRSRSRYVNGDEFDALESNWVTYNLDASLSGNGAVYVFERDLTAGWRKTAYLKAANSDGQDAFGRSLSLAGEYLAVGAPGESSAAAGSPDDNGAPASGAAYLFHRVGPSWSQTSYVKSWTPNSSFGVGCHVALDELPRILVVGSCRQQWTETFDPQKFGKVSAWRF